MSYADALMKRLLDALHLPFSLSMNSGSVVLTASISIGGKLTFSIRPISSAFSMFDC